MMDDLNTLFKDILENTPLFTEEGVLEVSKGEKVNLKGFFYSGTYGMASEAGYAREKAYAKQSFEIAKGSLPEAVKAETLPRKYLTIRGKRYLIVRVTGNDSGVLIMELSEYGNKT